MSEIIACLVAASETAQRVAHENRLVNRYTARDFTPFRFMSGWGEVPSTHMLAFFLDPDEDHGQGTLFQELFIKRLQLQPVVGARLPKTNWKVEAERRYAEYGQLDMLLTAADYSFGICLENKPRNQTIDQPRQLTSYRQLLQNRHLENYLLIYLSRETRHPSSDSLHPDDRKPLQLPAIISTSHTAALFWTFSMIGIRPFTRKAYASSYASFANISSNGYNLKAQNQLNSCKNRK